MNNIDKAVEILNNGGVIIFPTDTAFGIGCRADNKEAVERVFKIRNRPDEKAVPVLFDSIDMVKNYVEEFDNDVLDLMKRYWPGGLTIVLNSKEDRLPSVVRGGGKTVGVRVPDHEIPLELIRRINCPIIGPSANFSGGETPYSILDLDKNLKMLVDYIIDGKTKEFGKSSTVISCVDKPWKILRQGALDLEL